MGTFTCVLNYFLSSKDQSKRRYFCRKNSPQQTPHLASLRSQVSVPGIMSPVGYGIQCGYLLLHHKHYKLYQNYIQCYGVKKKNTLNLE